MAATLILGTSQGRGADWTFLPRSRGTLEFVSNPQFVPSSVSSYIGATADATAELSGELAQHADWFDLTVAPRVLFVRYLDHTIFNHDDQFLNLAGDVRDERMTWSATAAGTRDTTVTSELGITGLTNTNRYRENFAFSEGPTYALTERLSLAAQLSGQANHYVDAGTTGLVDYRYGTMDANATYALTERTQLLLEASVNELSAALPGGRSINDSLQAQAIHQLSETWKLTTALGGSRVISPQGDQWGSLYTAALNRTRERWSADLKASRSITPTGRGVLSKYDDYVLDGSYQLTERLTTDAAAEFSRNRDLAGTPANGSSFSVRYFSVRADLQWQLAQEWTASFAAQAQKQYTTLSSANTARAESYRVSASLSWNGNPQRVH